jgi:hypothetical protein
LVLALSLPIIDLHPVFIHPSLHHLAEAIRAISGVPEES